MSNEWNICAVIYSDEMPINVLKAFNWVLDRWGVTKQMGIYVGWVLGDLNLNKEIPDSLELNKMIVDDWLVNGKGVPDKYESAILIRYID